MPTRRPALDPLCRPEFQLTTPFWNSTLVITLLVSAFGLAVALRWRTTISLIEWEGFAGFVAVLLWYGLRFRRVTWVVACPWHIHSKGGGSPDMMPRTEVAVIALGYRTWDVFDHSGQRQLSLSGHWPTDQVCALAAALGAEFRPTRSW